MNPVVVDILLIVILIGVNAFFAAGEIALISVRPLRIRSLAQRGSGGAKAVLRLIEDPSRYLAAIQIGITFAGFLASASGAVALAVPLADLLGRVPLGIVSGNSRGLALVLVTAIISYVTLIIGELVPKRIAMQKSEKIAVITGPVIGIVSRLASPLIAALTVCTNAVVKLFGATGKETRNGPSEEEIKQLVMGHRTLLDQEKEMIHEVLRFGDAVAREVMIPKPDIVGLPEGSTVGDALKAVQETGFSRFPLYRGDLDTILGIVSVKDLMQLALEGNLDTDLTKVARPAYFVPETKKVLDLFEELRERRSAMAFVVDEYGGTSGLVTTELLAEQVVGDIRDEHDRDEDEVRLQGVDEAVVDAGLTITEINDELKLSLPVGGDYDTVAGLIMAKLDRIPEIGDEVRHSGIVLRVEGMDGNRILKVRVSKEGPKRQESE